MGNQLKKRLDNKEIIEFHNGNDIATISKMKFSLGYIFIFNTKGLFSYKSFSIFQRKFNEKVLQHSLVEAVDE